MRGAEYASAYGPRAGDQIWLGDSGLVIEVESDSQIVGEEFLAGFGKTARDGIHLHPSRTSESCDVVISNVVVLDAELGIRKVSIGIRSGRIVAIGRAGNPNTLPDVDVVVGAGSLIISGEGLLATAGIVDTHVHAMTPRVLDACLASGVTTVISQEIGPHWGCGFNSPWALRHAFQSVEAWPINVGFLARGSSSRPDPLREAVAEGGACGFKVHEDMGAHARALDTALSVADDFDVQVAIHTDGLNESLEVADTLSVIAGRTVHAFHVEGCGGGHVPNVLELAGVANVIASSTNPTLPFGRDAVEEHLNMIVAAHHLSTELPGDLALAADRIRAATMGAEGVLHDLGVIAITSSDAQGMGRAGETVRRTLALASKMKRERCAERAVDNERVLRFIAKMTINPAIAHGLSHEVGSVAVGKLADLVLWRPEYFGAKPELVIKGGFPAYGTTGDPNATIETAQPLVLGPLFGGFGPTPAEISVAFVSQAARDLGLATVTKRRLVPVAGTRGIGVRDMILNNRVAEVRVDPGSLSVTVDGDLVQSPASDAVTLNRLYYL